MKVYVVLQWFYEGDSYLVNSFVGVKLTYEDALVLIPKGKELLTKENFTDFEDEPEDEPNDWGQYGSESKYEIRECVI